MLKLTVKPGEYLLIGENIKVIFTGGSANNIRILVDAPKSYSIARSKALEKEAAKFEQDIKEKYYKDRKLSKEAVQKIKAILKEEKRKAEIGITDNNNNEKLT